MYLGAEIGGTKLQIVAADAAGDITRRWRGTVRKELGGPAICAQITDGISEILDVTLGSGHDGRVVWRGGLPGRLAG